jgi:hypothetical protein
MDHGDKQLVYHTFLPPHMLLA